MRQPVLWYFADPMCSWCWGFTPVISAIKEQFSDRLKLALVLGGLRPGTSEPMDEQLRNDILHHWHDVQKMTGQAFAFDDALPPGFIYNTEPPSRAVLAFAEFLPDETLSYFKRVQQAFYTEQTDVTCSDNLLALASEFGVDGDKFIAHYQSDAMHEKVMMHFKQARQLGISGFPTTILQKDDNFHLLSGGYKSFEELGPELALQLEQS